MKPQTITEYRAEISRVEQALAKTDSEYLRRDYGKYLKRLKREIKQLRR